MTTEEEVVTLDLAPSDVATPAAPAGHPDKLPPNKKEDAAKRFPMRPVTNANGEIIGYMDCTRDYQYSALDTEKK